ncbi:MULTISPECIES: acyl carrier protein [unclassified Streptomyces]|uniref:acyl carrier protein n=1 Tax=unclassified Streptomyces TaxID=2593676 RepID=UPI004042C91E
MSPTLPADDHTAELAALVRTAWAEGLGHEDFADDENFFAIGGHSMCAVRITRTLKSRLDSPLTVRQFFRHPTVAELALFLAGTVPARAYGAAGTEAGA